MAYDPSEPESSLNRLPVDLPTDAVFPVKGSGPFGDLPVAEVTPEVQLDFVHGKSDEDVYEYTAVTGSIAYNNSMVELSTGATQFGTAYIRSHRVVRYRPGQGALFRFTALFDDPVSGVSQTAGCYGGSENGMFVGYNYNDPEQKFGFCLQSHGQRDIHVVEVTAAASGAETIDVELNGTTFNIAVTAGTTAHNAQELAEGAYTGWIAFAIGTKVYFLADNVGVRGGAYSVAAQSGTFTGTMTQEVAGVAVTEDWVYQRDWNGDRFDGTGPSGMTLDPKKGNVYQISFEYLGFGQIKLAIEDSETGNFVTAHTIKYANKNTLPSVSQPIFALGAAVSGVSVGSDVTVKMGSCAGLILGKKKFLGEPHAADVSASIGATTSKPAFSIRNNAAYISATVDRVNLRDLLLNLISFSPSGSNRAMTVRGYLNATLTAPRWTSHGAESYASIDTAATAVSGGHLLFAKGVGVGNDWDLDLNGDTDFVLRPGEVLTLEVETNGNAGEYTIGVAWKEG